MEWRSATVLGHVEVARNERVDVLTGARNQ